MLVKKSYASELEEKNSEDERNKREGGNFGKSKIIDYRHTCDKSIRGKTEP